MQRSAALAAMCMFCDRTDDVAFCEGCNDFVCNKCWTRIRAHRDNLSGPGGIPHQRVDPKIKEKMVESMAEPADHNEERRQHQEDEDTTWFALDKDDGGEPILAEYRRYASIMMDCVEGAVGPRYPRLVSFIGETGAGKSSLIRLLIGPTRRASNADAPPIAAPIIGRAACDIPTSADVHLYLDPHSRFETNPILFADCEGFKGGESSVAANTAENSSDQRPTAAASDKDRNMLRELGVKGKKRILKWAQRNAQGSEETSKRTFAIKEMYPQVFYAFSDVIVFVLTQPKTLEIVVEELLKWADKNYKGSTNLPSKPHVIIAINKCEPTTPEDQWSIRNATAHLLSATNSQIRKNVTFAKYASIWESRALEIEDMRDLLKCYYSSVSVVRIPHKSRYNLLNEQRDKLYELILDCCLRSYHTKLGKRMLADIDEFGLYLSLAFDHFAESLDVPFDFIRASLKSHPPPETFQANLYSFILQVKRWKGFFGQVQTLFDLVKPMVASCIMLDSSRNQRMGHPKAWFTAVSDGGKSYSSMCNNLLLEYFDSFVQCSFALRDPLWPGRYRSCEQRKKTHGNMHRHYRGGQTIEHKGEFVSRFNPDEYDWAARVLEEIENLQGFSLEHEWNGDRHGWVQAHQNCVQQFYKKLGVPKEFGSHAICLCCLSNPPEHHLQCGHVICNPCAIDFGRDDDLTQIVVEQCPVCEEAVPGNKMSQTTILRPPQFSGQRILVLDGGGVRGIASLRVLEALEKELNVPLQKFFDLVVGTSTGGIIALAFGDLQMPVQKCIKEFEALVDEAFTLRKGQKLHVIKHLQKYYKRSKYETKPLNRALQAVFNPPRLMFGRRDSQTAAPLNVAVTAASGTGGQGFILSNYNTRTSPNIPRCQRYRPERGEDELEVWEAARSTSAAIGFFKPYKRNIWAIQPPEFTDGGLFQNNPIQVALEESRSLAKSRNQALTPDIVLSVGTGLPRSYLHFGHPRYVVSETQTTERPWYRVLFSVVSFQIKLNLDAERRWRDQVRTEPEIKDRMYRINPWLGEDPPEMDDKDCVPRLSKVVAQDLLHEDKLRNKILKTASALAASSFYFTATRVVSERVGVLQLSGLIKCRLSGSESDIRGLGKFLSQCPSSFLIQNIPEYRRDQQVSIPVHAMVEDGIFEEIETTIEVPGEEAETIISLKLPGLIMTGQLYPISGFPRGLFRQDATFVSRRKHGSRESSIADSGIVVPVVDKEVE